MRVNLWLTALVGFIAFVPLSWATNLVVPLIGSSSMGGLDYSPTLVNLNCMRQNGWDVEPISSAPQSDETALPDQLSKVSGSPGHVHELQNISISSRDPNDPRNTQQIDSQVVSTLQGLTQSLKGGDQFLLQVYAHGNSNCDRSKESDDLSQAIPNFDQCDHSFAVNLPNGSSVKVDSKDLVPILQKLQNRGVKVAVDVKSCFGGAVIKDFASAGICAQAYSTPSNVAYACGGPGTASPHEESYLYDTSIAFSCKGLTVDQAFSGIDTSASSHFDSGQRRCMEGASQLVTGKNLSSGSSLADEYRTLRSVDQSDSQPVGSNQPFWIIGNLGLLGDDASKVGVNPCVVSTPDFISNLAKDLDRLGMESSYAPGCSAKAEITRFFNDPTRRAVMDQYLKKLQKLQSTNYSEDALIDQFLKQNGGGVSAQSAAKKLALQLAGSSAPPSLIQSINEDPVSYVRMRVLQAAIDVSSMGASNDPRMQTMMAAVKAQTDQARSVLEANGITASDLQTLSNNEAKLGKNAKANVNDMKRFIEEEISPMERQLVNELSNSKDPNSYWSCALKKNPNLARANAACDSFQINPH